MATELGYSPGTINLLASQLWKLLSDVFGEKVIKANLRGAIKRFKNKPKPPLPKTSKSFKIFISDRSQNPESSITEELRRTLQDAGQEIVIDENWLQRNDEELNEYDCFLLIVSSDSEDESDIIRVIKDKKRSYRSRKFTQTTLENFVQAMNLSIMGTSTHLTDKGTGFIVMMLQKQN